MMGFLPNLPFLIDANDNGFTMLLYSLWWYLDSKVFFFLSGTCWKKFENYCSKPSFLKRLKSSLCVFAQPHQARQMNVIALLNAYAFNPLSGEFLEVFAKVADVDFLFFFLPCSN